MKDGPKFGAYHRERGWVEDTGVGGTYSWDVARAGWRDSLEQWVEELVACDIVDPSDFSEPDLDEFSADHASAIRVLEHHDWLFVRLF